MPDSPLSAGGWGCALPGVSHCPTFPIQISALFSASGNKDLGSPFCRKRPGKDKEAEMELGLSAGKPSQMPTHKEALNKTPKSTALLVRKVIWGKK